MPLGNLCWGPGCTSAELKRELENCKLTFRHLLTNDEVIAAAVGQLSWNKIVDWKHGRMEFGPRALGNCSILVLRRDPHAAENLNT